MLIGADSFSKLVPSVYFLLKILYKSNDTWKREDMTVNKCFQYQLLVCTCMLWLADSEMSASLTRAIHKAGFHRDLHSEVIVHNSELKTDCRLMMVENLPAGCYIDIYQIHQIRHFGGPMVWSEGVIDLEKPEYLSGPHMIHVYLDIIEEWRSNISLPVHLRYHRPVSSNEPFVKVLIPPPQLYYTCPDSYSISDASLTARCNSSTSALCTWHRIYYRSPSVESSIAVVVPVGEMSHKVLVIVITLLVTGVSCVWLLAEIWRKSQPIKMTAL